jgi:PmbA protein
MEKIDLVTPVEKAFNLLSTLDLDFFDIYSTHSRSFNIEFFGKGFKEAKALTDLGLGVRAFKNKGLGLSFTQSLDLKDVIKTVNQAALFAKVAQSDPNFKGIPGPAKAPEVPDLVDNKIRDLNLDEAIRLAEEMLDAVDSIKPGAIFDGGLHTGLSQGYLATSTGVLIETRKTSIFASIAPSYRKGNDVGSSIEHDSAISLKEINFSKLGSKAATKALNQFGAKNVKSEILPTIFTPNSAGLLIGGLISAITGESVVKGRTFASDLLGCKVAPKFLEVDDNGTIPGAIGSSTYDSEGVPRKFTKVINKGRIQTFLHNSYSAGIAGVETTGHATRGGYSGNIGVGTSNVKVKPGDSSLDEMLNETKRGILIVRASLSPNITTGDFSSTIHEGFLIENGEKIHSSKNIMIGGNILELYKGIKLISKEGRTIGKGNFIPAIKINKLRVAGN